MLRLKPIPVNFKQAPVRWLFLAVLRLYQASSAVRPPLCRYQPTCSEYMVQAVLKRGLFVGVALGIRRIVRCNPFTSGGHDPVP